MNAGRRERVLDFALPAALGLALLAAWQLATRMFNVPGVILPAPSDVLAAFGSTYGELMRNAWITGLEALAAFVLATVLGVAIALFMVCSSFAMEAFYPHLVLFQIIPKVALAPLFVVWLGFESASRLSYSIFISFFPITLATMAGLMRADANVLRLARALTASRWQTLVHVQIPYAMPYFFNGLKIAATMSVIGIVVGEFISSQEGLGHYILVAQSRSDTAHIFTAVIVLCLVGLIPYGIAAACEHLMKKRWRG